MGLAPEATRANIGAPGADASSMIEKVQAPKVMGLIYPPKDPGIPINTIEECLAAQSDLVRRLRIHVAQDPKLFAQRFAKPLENMAAWVSTMPATQQDLFSGPGGLFRACVELAFGAFQASDGRIFMVHAGVEERHLLEVRWRYICFLAALVWPIGKTLEQVRVSSSTGAQWSPRIEPLKSWGDANSTSSFYCAWPRQPFELGPSSTGSALMIAIAGEENIRWLEQGSPVLMTALINIAAGVRQDRYATAFDLVEKMWKLVCAREEARRPQTYGRLEFGRHLAPYLVDVMSELVSGGVWKLGAEQIYADANGVYIRWPEGAHSIIEHASRKGIEGIPTTPAGLLTALEDNELIIAAGESGALIEISDEAGEICAAVKLAKPEAIVPEFSPGAFLGARPVTATAILKADPIAQAKEVAAKRTKKPAVEDAKLNPAEVMEPPPPGPDLLQTTLPLKAETEQAPATVAKVATAQVEEASEERAKVERVEQAIEPSTEVGDGQEAFVEISYYDELPDSWKSQLRRREGEVLGKLISIWKEQAPTDCLVSTPEGSAFAKSVLDEHCSNGVDFLANIAKTGILYVNPTTPGRLVHELVHPPGSKKRHFFIIAKFASKQLGIV